MDAPDDASRDRPRGRARRRRFVARAWACALLAIGAGSGAFEVGRGFLVRDADGRDLRGRWLHAADPPDARLARAFGEASGRIVAALSPAPPRECWVRLRVDRGERVALIDA